jgi:hypothetical protein
MIISGSTALEFFDRTEYINSDLDLYVDHRYREPIALWLQSIGYTFMPRPSIGPQSIETALNDDSHEHNNTGTLVYEYPCAIMVLDFIKSTLNPRPIIQLITSTASPLELVLRFHSSKIRRYICSLLPINLVLSLRNELNHSR